MTDHINCKIIRALPGLRNVASQLEHNLKRSESNDEENSDDTQSPNVWVGFTVQIRVTTMSVAGVGTGFVFY